MDKSLIFDKLQKKSENLEIIENLYADDIFANYYHCYEVTFVNSKFTHKNIPLMAYKNSRIRSFDSQPLCYSWIGYLRLMVRR